MENVSSVPDSDSDLAPETNHQLETISNSNPVPVEIIEGTVPQEWGFQCQRQLTTTVSSNTSWANLTLNQTGNGASASASLTCTEETTSTTTTQVFQGHYQSSSSSYFNSIPIPSASSLNQANQAAYNPYQDYVVNNNNEQQYENHHPSEVVAEDVTIVGVPIATRLVPFVVDECTGVVDLNLLSTTLGFLAGYEAALRLIETNIGAGLGLGPETLDPNEQTLQQLDQYQGNQESDFVADMGYTFGGVDSETDSDAEQGEAGGDYYLDNNEAAAAAAAAAADNNLGELQPYALEEAETQRRGRLLEYEVKQDQRETRRSRSFPRFHNHQHFYINEFTPLFSDKGACSASRDDARRRNVPKPDDASKPESHHIGDELPRSAGSGSTTDNISFLKQRSRERDALLVPKARDKILTVAGSGLDRPPPGFEKYEKIIKDKHGGSDVDPAFGQTKDFCGDMTDALKGSMLQELQSSSGPARSRSSSLSIPINRNKTQYALIDALFSPSKLEGTTAFFESIYPTDSGTDHLVDIPLRRTRGFFELEQDKDRGQIFGTSSTSTLDNSRRFHQILGHSDSDSDEEKVLIDRNFRNSVFEARWQGQGQHYSSAQLAREVAATMTFWYCPNPRCNSHNTSDYSHCRRCSRCKPIT